MAPAQRNRKKDLQLENSEAKEDTKQAVPKPTEYQYVPLPFIETCFYWSMWVVVVGYMTYKTALASNEFKGELFPGDFGKGLKIIGREKDIGDVEWEFWLNVKLVLLGSLALHSFAGLIVSRVCPMFKAWFYLVFTLIILTMFLGICPVVWLMVHCVIMYIAAMSQSVKVVWATALMILTSLQQESMRTWQLQYLTDNAASRDFTLFVALMSILRCLSFSLDFCWHERSEDNEESLTSYTLFDLLCYNFYLPLFNNGPVMTYDTFYKQFHQPLCRFTKQEVLSITWDCCRTLWWFIFLEIYLHFVYSTALVREAPVFKSLSGWTLSGIMYSQLHIFLTKYVVLYRFSGVFARLDHLDPPRAPRCVSTLYTFTDMWRYFDRGLNVWMRRYIYVPMGGSRHGVFWQSLASFLAFGFVWAWHGANRDTLWWFLPNWLGVAVEGAASSAFMLPLIKNIEDRLSLRMCRRVRAAVCTISCACLILSNMVFLIGPLPVSFYIRKIFYQDFPVSSFVCFTCLYFSIQTSIDTNRYKNGKW